MRHWAHLAGALRGDDVEVGRLADKCWSGGARRKKTDAFLRRAGAGATSHVDRGTTRPNVAQRTPESTMNEGVDSRGAYVRHRVRHTASARLAFGQTC
jgi:hypothetical protein